jgi:2'-5' RNA ligase
MRQAKRNFSMDNLIYSDFFYDLLFEEIDNVHTVMVELPHLKALEDYIASIPEEILYEPTNPQYGREKHPHITVLYGIEPMEGEKAKALLRKVPSQVTATLGTISMFEAPKFDVLKIDVTSPYLARINKFLTSNVEYENDHPSYHPHVTIAYLKKGEGKQFINDNRFVGTKFVFKTFLYSDEHRNHEKIPMRQMDGSSSLEEYGYGAGGGYGNAAGGAVAASGWAGTFSSPQTSTRLNMYPKQSGMRQTSKANTVRGIDPYDAVNPQDLQDPRFSPDEIRAGIRAEMGKMEYPNKDIARNLVIHNLETNPKYYSDLHQYFDTEK